MPSLGAITFSTKPGFVWQSGAGVDFFGEPVPDCYYMVKVTELESKPTNGDKIIILGKGSLHPVCFSLNSACNVVRKVPLTH